MKALKKIVITITLTVLIFNSLTAQFKKEAKIYLKDKTTFTGLTKYPKFKQFSIELKIKQSKEKYLFDTNEIEKIEFFVRGKTLTFVNQQANNKYNQIVYNNLVWFEIVEKGYLTLLKTKVQNGRVKNEELWFTLKENEESAYFIKSNFLASRPVLSTRQGFAFQSLLFKFDTNKIFKKNMASVLFDCEELKFSLAKRKHREIAQVVKLYNKCKSEQN